MSDEQATDRDATSINAPPGSFFVCEHVGPNGKPWSWTAVLASDESAMCDRHPTSDNRRVSDFCTQMEAQQLADDLHHCTGQKLGHA